MASRTVVVAEWHAVETSIPIEEQRLIDIARLEKERDHWLAVAAEAEASGDMETVDGALLAAERREDSLHNLRIQNL